MNGTNGQEAFTQTEERDRTEKITTSALRQLLVKQNYRCALTGWDLRPENASVDHVQPLARGGTNTIGNIQIVHGDANRAKGVMSQAEFLALCRAVTNNLSA